MNHVEATVLDVAERKVSQDPISVYLEGCPSFGMVDGFDRLAVCARTQLTLRQQEHDAGSRILRSRLLDKMFMRDKALCVVCAPGGFGKTELANQYRSRLGSKKAAPWVDASSMAFRTLLKKTEPNRFLRRLARGSVLMIDDVPLLEEQSAFAFKRLVVACCANGHEVVVTTRHRFIAALFDGEATFIDAKDLLLSKDELRPGEWDAVCTSSRLGKDCVKAGQEARHAAGGGVIPSIFFQGEAARSHMVECVMDSPCMTVVEAASDLIALVQPAPGDAFDQLLRLLSDDEACLMFRSYPHVCPDVRAGSKALLQLNDEERRSLWHRKGPALSALLQPRVQQRFGLQTLSELVTESLVAQEEVLLAATLLTEHASQAERERFAREHGWRLVDEGQPSAVVRLWSDSRWFDLEIPELLMLAFALMLGGTYAQSHALLAEAAVRSQGTAWRAVVCLLEEAFFDVRLAEASDSSSSDTTAVGAASGLALLDEVWEREELERHSSDSLEACESVEQLLVSLASMCRTSFVDAFSQVEGIVSEARLREEEELILERLLLDGEATDAEPLRQRRANRTNLAAVCFLLASLRHASRRGIAVGKQVSQVDLQRLVEKSLEPALADVDGARPSLSLRDQDTHEPCDSPSLARRPSLIEGALAYLARELAGECGIALAMPHCAKLAEQDLERILRSSKNGSATSVAAKGKQPDLAARLQSTPGRKRVTEVDGREQRLSVVSLRLFGAFACKVFTQEGAVDVRLRDKARTFITLLAMKHGREVSRDWISRVMWPGERCNGPKHVSLNSMWSTVTRALGGKGGNVFAMTKNRNAVVMNDDWTVSDLAELEKLCALVEGGHDLDRRELLFAIKDLYRGELLPGCRNEEVVACRKAWKRRVCEVLASVAQELVSSGEHDLALSYLDFAQQVDPLSEKVCWLQSNALCHVKQYFAAMDAIIEYRKQTREHYATEGSARLNELYERLLTEAE